LVFSKQKQERRRGNCTRIFTIAGWVTTSIAMSLACPGTGCSSHVLGKKKNIERGGIASTFGRGGEQNQIWPAEGGMRACTD